MSGEIEEVLIPLDAVLTDEIKDKFVNLLADMTMNLEQNYGVPDEVAYVMVANIMVNFFQNVAEEEAKENGVKVRTEKRNLQ